MAAKKHGNKEAKKPKKQKEMAVTPADMLQTQTKQAATQKSKR